MEFVEKKVKCARVFAELLANRLKGRLIKVVLFGSVAKGSCSADSDVDLLIIVDRVDEDVKRIIAEFAFEASHEFQEPIEYIVMEFEEYKARGLDNPFIHEVEHYGKVLHYDPEPEKEMIRKLLDLAEEYYKYAERCAQRLMYRAAIDLGQNAIELMLKALILVKGEVEREVVTRLYRALELRNKSRYDPDYKPLEVDVNEVLQAYREIREVARKILKENEIPIKT